LNILITFALQSKKPTYENQIFHPNDSLSGIVLHLMHNHSPQPRLRKKTPHRPRSLPLSKAKRANALATPALLKLNANGLTPMVMANATPVA